MPAGSYDIQVCLAGTQTVVLFAPGVTLEPGTTYTLFAVGLTAGEPALNAILEIDSESPAKGRARPFN